MSATRARHPTRRRDDRGLVVTELAIVAPALLAMLVLAIFGARVTWSERQVQSSSAAAARAAAQQGTIGRAEQVADEVVGDNLQDAGLTCSGGPSVSTTPGPGGFGPGGSVSVEVGCVAIVSDLVFITAPGSYTFEHTSTEVIDALRGGS